MHSDHLVLAYQIINDLGLGNYVPVGEDSAERYDHVYSTCRKALSLLDARLHLRLEVISDHQGVERRELLLDHMAAGAVIAEVMDRGYRLCRLIDDQELQVAMPQIYVRHP